MQVWASSPFSEKAKQLQRVRSKWSFLLKSVLINFSIQLFLSVMLQANMFEVLSGNIPIFKSFCTFFRARCLTFWILIAQTMLYPKRLKHSEIFRILQVFQVFCLELFFFHTWKIFSYLVFTFYVTAYNCEM